MLTISDAAPDAVRDAGLRTAANGMLLKSLAHIIAACARHLPAEAGAAAETVAAVDPRRKLSGMLHVHHSALVKAVKGGEPDAIRAVLGDLAAFALEAPEAVALVSVFDGAYPAAVYDRYVDVSYDANHATYGMTLDYARPNGSAAGSAQALHRAFERLRAIDRAMFDELQTVVSDIVLVQSDIINASTSLKTLGIVTMSHLKPGQIWTRYLEHLAHEAGHHHLYYVWMADPIILNEDSGLYGSPLRRDRRPLSGIYHAMFVLGRTLLAMRRLRESAGFDPDEDLVNTAYNNAENPSSFEEKFEDCWRIISEHAKLTELGRKLMTSTREMALSN